MKRQLQLLTTFILLIPALVFSQTIAVDSVTTAMTPNSGRHVWNANDFLLRDTVIVSIPFRDNGTNITLRATTDTVKMGMVSFGTVSNATGQLDLYNSSSAFKLTTTSLAQTANRQLRYPILAQTTDTTLTNGLLGSIFTRGSTSGYFPQSTGSAITWVAPMDISVAQNYIPYFPTANTQERASVYWEPTNLTLGVDIATGLLTTASIHTSKASGTNDVVLDSYGTSGRVIFRAAGGTRSAIDSTANSQGMGGIEGRGYDGVAWTTGRAEIAIKSTQLWSSTLGRNGTKMTFAVTPNNSTTIATSMQVTSSGTESLGGFNFIQYDADGSNTGTFSVPTDLPSNKTWTFPVFSGTVLISTLTTNAKDTVNSVWGESNDIAFEGATANNFEGRLAPADVTTDQTWTLPDATGNVILSTLSTNAQENANSIWGASNALVFEGATANAFETSLSPIDATANRTLTLPDTTGQLMVSTLTTNGVSSANAIWGESNNLAFEGATADAFEGRITVTDPTADRTWTFPDTTGTVFLSTLSTNKTDAANSIWGESNNLAFEGATADAFEGRITVSDPTADRTWTFPDTTGRVVLSTLSTNNVDIANSIWAESNALAFEGATANAFEGRLQIADVTADRTWTFPDTTGNVLVSTLSTNSPDAANSIWGASNAVVFEGATANTSETSLVPADPTSDQTITLPDTTGALIITTLATNTIDAANSWWGVSNNLVFEGVTADAFETSITLTDPTADRTITLPNATGVVGVCLTAKRTADTSSTASATNEPDGQLFLPLISGVYYHFEFTIIYQSALATSGGIFSFSAVPTNTIFSANCRTLNGADGAAYIDGAITAADDFVSSSNVETANTNYVATIIGNILPTASTNLQFEWKPETNGQALTIKQGSTAIAWVIP